MLYIGIMSGTSADGADAILVDFSASQPRVLGFVSEHFPAELRSEVLRLNIAGENEIERSYRASNQLARVYANAVQRLLVETSTQPRDIRAVACHGQTVRHRPDLGFTTQLNNAALLAELTGIDVASDFRSRDLAAGGQGAPLVPLFHDGVFRSQLESRVIANIGGIANLTFLAPDSPVWGFDCGPGNCLLDDWINLHHSRTYDANGEWAAQGTVSPALLARLLGDSYFALSPPKSTGRDLFNLAWLNCTIAGETPADVQATLLEFTARTICDAVVVHAAHCRAVIVCGGGANNAALMARLGMLLPNLRIDTTDAHGVPTQQVEALAFAWLGKCCVDGTKLDFTRTTGAKRPTTIGALHRA